MNVKTVNRLMNEAVGDLTGWHTQKLGLWALSHLPELLAERRTPAGDASVTTLADLRDNWDSYGGHPITEEALWVARVLAVVPKSDGGIQVEWHAYGWDVEIEVLPDGTPGTVLLGRWDS